jgi:hypothetical protein
MARDRAVERYSLSSNLDALLELYERLALSARPLVGR